MGRSGEGSRLINDFHGRYLFLSNFYPCRIEWNGLVFPSTEHAYQACKSLDPADWALFTDSRIKPGQAKKIAKRLPLRSDWEQIKISVMEAVLRIKFSDPQLRALLILTYPQELVEGNWWGDRFWGVCDGVGENNLGKLLMKIRDEFV